MTQFFPAGLHFLTSWRVTEQPKGQVMSQTLGGVGVGVGVPGEGSFQELQVTLPQADADNLWALGGARG